MVGRSLQGFGGEGMCESGGQDGTGPCVVSQKWQACPELSQSHKPECPHHPASACTWPCPETLTSRDPRELTKVLSAPCLSWPQLTLLSARAHSHSAGSQDPHACLCLLEAFADSASEVPLLSPKTLCCIPSVGGAPLCLEPEPSVHSPLLTPLNQQRGMSSALLASGRQSPWVACPVTPTLMSVSRLHNFLNSRLGWPTLWEHAVQEPGVVGDTDRHGKRCQMEHLGQVSLTTGAQGREKV